MTNHGRYPLSLAVDLVILTVEHGTLMVLVVERAKDPYRGRLALPGGFVIVDEDLRDAAVRELAEETSIDGETLRLTQLGTYGAPGRDPRGRVVSVAFVGLGPQLPAPVAGSDARAAHWMPVDSVRTTLAFDHDVILCDALDWLRATVERTGAATVFCGETLTEEQLRRLEEIVRESGPAIP